MLGYCGSATDDRCRWNDYFPCIWRLCWIGRNGSIDVLRLVRAEVLFLGNCCLLTEVPFIQYGGGAARVLFWRKQLCGC